MTILIVVILVLCVLAVLPSYDTRQKIRLAESPRTYISGKEMDMIGEYIRRNKIRTAEEFKACVDRDLAKNKTL